MYRCVEHAITVFKGLFASLAHSHMFDPPWIYVFLCGGQRICSCRSCELQDCAVLVYATESGKISQLQQPCGGQSVKSSAASLLPAPVDEALPEHLATPSPTSPLYIFHRKDKHTTVTLDHSTVQSYLQQGIASLTHAVDHRQAAAPSPVDARIRIRSYTQLACDGTAAAEHSGSIRASTTCSTSRCVRSDVPLSGLATNSQCSSGSATVLPLPTSASPSKCTCSNAADGQPEESSISDRVIPASTCVVCASCVSGGDPGSFVSGLTSRCGSSGLSSDSCLSVAREAAPHLPQPPSHDVLIERLLAQTDLEDGTHLKDDVIQTQQQPAVRPMLKGADSLLAAHAPTASGKPVPPPSIFGRAISTAIPSEVYGGIAVKPWADDVQQCDSDTEADACIYAEPCTVTRAQPPAQALPISSRTRPMPLTVNFDIPAEPSWMSKGFCTPLRESRSATPAPATPELTPSSEINFGQHSEWHAGIRSSQSCAECESTHCIDAGDVRVGHAMSQHPTSTHSHPGSRSARLDRWVVQLEPEDSVEQGVGVLDLASLLPEPGTREIGVCGHSEEHALGDEDAQGERLEEEQSLAWKTGAWSDSAREDCVDGLGEVRSTIESWQSGISGVCCATGRQPRLLSALPADTPAALLFGLLLPLSMGWHITLPQARGSCGEVVWGALFQAPNRTFDAVFMPSACCDELTRLAIEALGGKAPSECVPGATALGAPLATLAACAMFGPSVTPGAVQSFVASMQPFGLRCAA